MINNDHAINVYRSSMFIIFKYYNHKIDLDEKILWSYGQIEPPQII